MSELHGLLELAEQAAKPPDVPMTAIPEGGRLYRFWRDAWRMDVEPQPHAEMANFIDDALGDRSFSSDQQTLVMLGVPRGTFKTTGVSEATPVEVLTRNPNAKILLDGFRHSVSKARLRAVRRKIENDDNLDVLFDTKAWKPGFRQDTWNDEEIFITTREDYTSREASIATAGVDRSMNSQHFDVIIADDVVTDTNVQTAEGRERVYQHIQDLVPILNPGGVLILVFTTWHPDDAYARIIKLDEDRERRGLPPRWRKLIRGAYDGPQGLFFPKRLTEAFLEETRETMGSRKFAAQYLLKPVADEDRTFSMDAMRQEIFSFFTVHGRPGGVVRRGHEQIDVETTIAWDPAGRKQSKTSDFHGISVVGTDTRTDWWVLEAIGLKAPPATVIDRILRLVLVYRPHAISIEDTFGSGLWIDMLRDEARRRAQEITVVEWSPGSVPKNERIVTLQPRWERRGIVLRLTPEGNSAYPKLLNQFQGFSVGRPMDHEDELDSLVQHASVARAPRYDANYRIDDNPVDEDWLAFRSRKRDENGDDPARSRAGRFGSTWIVG